MKESIEKVIGGKDDLYEVFQQIDDLVENYTTLMQNDKDGLLSTDLCGRDLNLLLKLKRLFGEFIKANLETKEK